MSFLYHGSIISGITELEARSPLHNANKQVVYLTDSIPYALLYIWDSERNGSSQKYVTGGFRDGQVFYEEQFLDQLRTFYQGVAGYLYRIPHTDNAQAVTNRAGLFWQDSNAAVADVRFIPDVYAELLAYEAAGKLSILRFSEQTDTRQAELTGMIAAYIRQSQFFANDDEQRRFMQKHFPAAWRQAHEPTD